MPKKKPTPRVGVVPPASGPVKARPAPATRLDVLRVALEDLMANHPNPGGGGGQPWSTTLGRNYSPDREPPHGYAGYVCSRYDTEREHPEHGLCDGRFRRIPWMDVGEDETTGPLG